MGFEERIAAASRASMVAATQLQAVIGDQLDAMTAGWVKATAEADTVESQIAGITAVVREYKEKLRQFASVNREGGPGDMPAVTLPATGIVRQSANGWTVSDAVLARLRTNMHEAQSAAREVNTRMFSARQRQTALEKARTVQGLIGALEAEAKRLENTRAATLARRHAEADSLRIAADRKLREAAAELAHTMRRLPPSMTPWSNAAWLSWSPLLTHSHVLLGMLRPQIAKVRG